MADRNEQQGGGQGGSGESERNPELDRALDRQRPDLQGDAEENRNLSGSSTWESLTERDPASTNSQREGQREYGDDRSSGRDQRGGDPATNGEI